MGLDAMLGAVNAVTGVQASQLAVISASTEPSTSTVVVGAEVTIPDEAVSWLTAPLDVSGGVPHLSGDITFSACVAQESGDGFIFGNSATLFGTPQPTACFSLRSDQSTARLQLYYGAHAGGSERNVRSDNGVVFEATGSRVV